MKTIIKIKIILFFALSIFYSASFAQSNSSNTQTVCVGSVENYRVNNPNSNNFEWNLTTPSGNTLDSLYDISDDDDSIRITWNNVGTFNLEVLEKDNNGCDGTPVNLTVNVVSLPNVISSSSSLTNEVCSGNSVQIQATGAVSYLWSNGATTANDSVSPTVQTTYTVVGTDANGCENTDAVTISVNQLPNVAINNVNPVCLGQVATLQASGASSFLWDNGSVNSNITVSPTLTQSTFSVVGTDLNGCEDTAQITIIVNQPPSTGPIFHN